MRRKSISCAANCNLLPAVYTLKKETIGIGWAPLSKQTKSDFFPNGTYNIENFLDYFVVTSSVF